MKKYISYTRKKINDNYYQDPNTNSIVEKATSGVTVFTETPYEVEGIMLGIVEFPDDSSDELVEYFRTLDEAFAFKFLTEEETNTFLSSLGEITVEDFIFTDNRCLEYDL